VSLRFLGRRLLGATVIMLLLSLVLFVLQRFSATDPVRQLVGANAPRERVDAMRAELGYDRPVLVQWVDYVGGLFRGDLQMSLRTRRPVAEDIGQFLPSSIELGLAAAMIAALLAAVLGITLATRSRAAVPVRLVLFAGAAAPGFLLALLGILLFSQYLGWLPGSGRTALLDAPAGPTGLLVLDGVIGGRVDVVVDAVRHLVLPATCVALMPAVAVGRTFASSLSRTLDSEHVRAARAQGQTPRQVLVRHGLRNSAQAPLSMAGLQLGGILTGLLIIEPIFALPGLGSYLQQSIPAGDFPAVAGVTLLLAAAYVVVNACVEILQHLADPRLRTTGA
jgi:peptide/nickel transport system permease protein